MGDRCSVTIFAGGLIANPEDLDVLVNALVNEVNYGPDEDKSREGALDEIVNAFVTGTAVEINLSEVNYANTDDLDTALASLNLSWTKHNGEGDGGGYGAAIEKRGPHFGGGLNFSCSHEGEAMLDAADIRNLLAEYGPTGVHEKLKQWLESVDKDTPPMVLAGEALEKCATIIAKLALQKPDAA